MGIKLRDTDSDEVTEIPVEASSLLACLMVLVKRSGGHVTISQEELDATNGTLVQNSAVDGPGVDLDFVPAGKDMAS